MCVCVYARDVCACVYKCACVFLHNVGTCRTIGEYP